MFHKLSLAETINITDVQGDGNVTVSAGSGSTVIITTCPHHVPGDEHSCTHCRALVLPKPVGKPKRLGTKTEKSCHMYIDNLAMLTGGGKILKCRSIIAKLMKKKTDPDSQVSLRYAASLNTIYEGDFKKVSRLLREVQAILPDTVNETEHRLWWGNIKSLAKLREGKGDAGIVFAKEVLPLLDMLAPGCITAYLLINHALLLTEIAATQDDREDRQHFMKMAEKDFHHAIEHAEYEHPKQMLHSQSRVPRFAKIGLAFLYLGCKESAGNFKLGTSNVSLDDIKRAKNVIDALDRDGMVCDSGQFQFMVAKTCLHYRLGSYQQAYDLAQEAKVFATKHSFGGFVKFADSIVQYLQEYNV
ncbi:hypothetical protein Bbelb_181940 [Branchiostoma belcheri]|nr:hypothetical protein Bbelb_181940 [Branchiostoma belcheri]